MVENHSHHRSRDCQQNSGYSRWSCSVCVPRKVAKWVRGSHCGVVWIGVSLHGEVRGRSNELWGCVFEYGYWPKWNKFATRLILGCALMRLSQRVLGRSWVSDWNDHRCLKSRLWFRLGRHWWLMRGSIVALWLRKKQMNFTYGR